MEVTEFAWEHPGKERSRQRERLGQRPSGRARLARRKAGEGTDMADAEGAEARWLEKRPDK